MIIKSELALKLQAQVQDEAAKAPHLAKLFELAHNFVAQTHYQFSNHDFTNGTEFEAKIWRAVGVYFTEVEKMLERWNPSEVET